MSIVAADSLEPVDPTALRKKARLRCTLWAGCGFGTLGHLPAAIAGILVLWLWLASIVWFCLELTSMTFWLAVIMSVLTVAFWAVEYVLIGKVRVVPGGRFFQEYWLLVAGRGYVGIAAVLAIYFLLVGTYKVAGTGMKGTLEPGDIVLHHKGALVEKPYPAQLILFRAPAESSLRGQVVAARILAVPGERLSRQGNHYVVGGRVSRPVGAVGSLRPVLVIPPGGTTVPAGSYFVVQDDPSAFDSQVFGWVRTDDILATRLLRFSGWTWAEEAN